MPLGTIASVIGIAAGVNSLFGGGGSGHTYGGSQSVSLQPLPLTPEQEVLFEDWFNLLYGGGQPSTNGGSLSNLAEQQGTSQVNYEGGRVTDPSSGVARLASDPNTIVPMQPDHVYVRNLNPDSPYYGEIIDVGPVQTTDYPPSNEQVNTSNVEQVGNALAYGGNVPGLVSEGQWDLPERLNPYLTAQGNFQLLGTGEDLGVTNTTGGGGSGDTESKTLLQRLIEDTEARKKAEEEFASSYGSASQPYRGYLQQFVDQGSPTPITISLGNFSTDFLSGTQRRQQDLGLKAAQAILANKLAEAGILRDIGVQYTPNAAYLEYFRNWLNPLYQAEQNRRYQIPSQTTTASVPVPGGGMLNNLANWVNLGTQALGLYNAWQGLNTGGGTGGLGYVVQPFMGD